MPCKNTRGRNTTQVVTVEPTMDMTTMLVPARAALAKPRAPLSFSASVARKQLSSTTMELSTIMPTPSTRPLMVITFRENPQAVITIRDTRIEVGIELPTIIDALKSPKNTKMMIMEMTTASTMVTATSCREVRIESASSRAISTVRFSSSASSSSMTSWTSEDSSMAVLLCCLVMEMEIRSSPLYREMPPRCSSA